MQQLTVRQASHTQLSDSRSLRMQKFHNVRKTENFNKTDTNGNGEVNK